MKEKNIEIGTFCDCCRKHNPPLNMFHITEDQLNVILNTKIKNRFFAHYYDTFNKKGFVALCGHCYNVITEKKEGLFDTNVAIKYLIS